MEIKVRDFNYMKECDGTYTFYFLGFDKEIHIIENHGIKVDPLKTMKTLTVQGMRYNPEFYYNKK